MSDKVRITRPSRNTKLDSKAVIVMGHLFEGDNVQLYVLSNDGKWYLQRPVKIRGKHWSGLCFVGDDASKADSSFQVVAIISNERPKSPVDTLPEGEQSDVLVLYRS